MKTWKKTYRSALQLMVELSSVGRFRLGDGRGRDRSVFRAREVLTSGRR
jgi:hypothetical protein